MKLPTLLFPITHGSLYVSASLPERNLLCAILHRALADLDTTVANGRNNLKCAVSWFRGHYDLFSEVAPPEFTYELIVEELQISDYYIRKINKLVRNAEKFIDDYPKQEPGKQVIWKVSQSS